MGIYVFSTNAMYIYRENIWNNILYSFLHNGNNSNNRCYIMGRKTVTRLIKVLIYTVILVFINCVFYFDSCLIEYYSLYRGIIYSICTGILVLLLIDIKFNNYEKKK